MLGTAQPSLVVEALLTGAPDEDAATFDTFDAFVAHKRPPEIVNK
jgi:hypothetical protein